MGDAIDSAQERDEFFRELALAEHQGQPCTGESRTNCAGCGEEIPEKRRLAVPGCTHCVKCQKDHEILSHWRAL